MIAEAVRRGAIPGAARRLLHGAIRGAVSGLAGGLIFGAVMTRLGMLPTIASLVRASSAGIGFTVHMIIAALIGAGFGLLVHRQRLRAGDLLFWGLTYGSLWWFVGPLTLLPELLGRAPAWDVRSAQAALPSLLGHLAYGATTALTFAAISRPAEGERPGLRPGGLVVGLLAGLLCGWLLGRLLDGQSQYLEASGMVDFVTHRVSGPATLLTGALAGILYAFLYPRRYDAAGPRLVRGTMYGLLCWMAGPLTAVPLLAGRGLAWSLPDVQTRFPALPAYLLFGAALALLYGWLESAARLLFSDEIAPPNQEGIGIQGLRAIGRGALAGLAGGLLFTVVMVQIGVLPAVAGLVGSGSVATGLVVHLVIANIIGAAYGLLFLRQSYDVGSGLGWGVSYGFFWWILGPLTLMPILLGGHPRWTVEVAGRLTASLVGHLAYGAILGVTFTLLEARYTPWWISHTQMEADRSARRREQVLTSAPALWTLVVVVALTLPIVLTCGVGADETAAGSDEQGEVPSIESPGAYPAPASMKSPGAYPAPASMKSPGAYPAPASMYGRPQQTPLAGYGPGSEEQEGVTDPRGACGAGAPRDPYETP